MIPPRSLFLLAVLQVLFRIFNALAAPTPDLIAAPLVTLDYGTFRGFNSAKDTESFLGIPFAEPPVDQLRFHNPVSPKSVSGIRNATWFGNACPQKPLLSPNESLPTNPGLNGVTRYLAELLPRSIVSNVSEDCLYLNVVRPAGVSEGAKLPVVVWIYGGAFEYSDASSYNGTHVVSRSLNLDSPIIYVSFNYRSNAFGFLGGKEVKQAGLGNFGLYDQRFALEWVQKYITHFGGNPRQVTVWGQSAGAISIMLHMAAHDGQLGELFRGAVMLSGSASPMHNITSTEAQDGYDYLVGQTNCTSAKDTLDCLRQAPYESLINAIQSTPSLLSYQALNTSWKPLVDGIFLKQSLRESLSKGNYAHVPAIVGSVDDEGTLFSLYSLNVTTTIQFQEYIQTNFLPGATSDEIQQLMSVYPESPSLGSPYDVGTNDTLTPEYKRISSFQGDFYFQVPRRYSLVHLARTQNVWGYLWKRGKYIPGIGSFHASDLQEFYNLTGSSDWIGADAIVNFAHNLDPNVPKNASSGSVYSALANISWPKYTPSSPQLMTFEDFGTLTLTNDTFRTDAISFLDSLQERMGM